MLLCNKYSTVCTIAIYQVSNVMPMYIVLLVQHGPISWQSKKQPMIALSSMEAEYMTESLTTHQIIWLRSLTAELSIPYSGPTTLNVDNQRAINYSNNAINHDCTKHINIQHHFVCEKLISNKIEIQYCATKDNLADLFMKALPKPKHKELVKQLGMA